MASFGGTSSISYTDVQPSSEYEAGGENTHRHAGVGPMGGVGTAGVLIIGKPPVMRCTVVRGGKVKGEGGGGGVEVRFDGEGESIIVVVVVEVVVVVVTVVSGGAAGV